MYPQALKAKAVNLRREGVSIPAMAKRLGIAKSTASLWARRIQLSEDVQSKLVDSRNRGRAKGREVLRLRREAQARDLKADAERMVLPFVMRTDSDHWKFVAAMLFWCEGVKRDLSSLVFVNSDPTMVAAFLRALRLAFPLDERKFHPLLHLHEYHDDAKQQKFWSKVTGIPTAQFHNTYLKPHTGKRERKGYQGCVSLRYYDARLARTLSAIYYAFAERTGA